MRKQVINFLAKIGDKDKKCCGRRYQRRNFQGWEGAYGSAVSCGQDFLFFGKKVRLTFKPLKSKHAFSIIKLRKEKFRKDIRFIREIGGIRGEIWQIKKKHI